MRWWDLMQHHFAQMTYGRTQATELKKKKYCIITVRYFVPQRHQHLQYSIVLKKNGTLLYKNACIFTAICYSAGEEKRAKHATSSQKCGEEQGMTGKR